MLYQSTKKNKFDKTNYRPVAALPNISRIYEKFILDNGTGSPKHEIKSDHVVNNLFYFMFFFFLRCRPNKTDMKETQRY